MDNVISERQIALALANASLHSKMGRSFQTSIEKYVFPLPNPELKRNESKLLAAKKRLSSEISHEFLKLVWKESKYVSTIMCVAAGIRKSFSENTLNINSIGAMLHSLPEFSKSNSRNGLGRHLERISEAAIQFDLIQKIDGKNSSKLLLGTELLHTVMLHVHTNNSDSILELQLQRAGIQSVVEAVK